MSQRREVSFQSMFPSPTAGDGKIRPNNARTGKRQPNAKPSSKRKVHCKNCGFPVDLAKNSNDGGSLEGSGAGGGFTPSSSDANCLEQEYRRGAGCPHCFSKAFSSERISRR